MVQERSSERAAALAGRVSEFLDRERTRDIRILGPAPSPIEKVNKVFRHQLLVKAGSRPPLRTLLDKLRAHLEAERVGPTSVILDVDPVSLL
jgi:primosomal protein N' (replication factor Y)